LATTRRATPENSRPTGPSGSGAFGVLPVLATLMLICDGF